MSVDFHIPEDGIALITINRPEKRNALDAEHYQALSAAWERVRDDSSIRAAIITGAGDKAFSSGADLKSYFSRKTDLNEFWQTQKGMLLNRGLEIWKPIVAAVNGYCLAGGMTLLLATDIRVAASHATFSLAEVKRGIIAGNGGTQRVMAQLPHAIAMEMLLTGDSIDAATAQRWGLINRVVDADKLLETAMEYARRIVKNAPLAVQAAKELALRGPELGLAGGLRFEQMVNKILVASDDAKEGTLAFQEKRPPVFKGS
ncbi:enoyl-CoA hydratase/isomerase family protein [Candidimonas sp. SYP-B2681]|uniref:enoyl-CoA hydratase/isomerase family protein n=1 Tax=Candidimonas sp. SYP-B2681 TaxID=2497686 RepID=UPI000F85EBC3|nr:enoyl-CoA hydratase/isomerase family protein [Candidimonas sp. SYP-B2681]RTZ44632.1 enoyl-CoA hydratase/isomerase family protein [Candidimonas sp. SYP-B2681]